MNILYLFCSFSRSINLFHNCSSKYINIDVDEHIDFNYIISCPSNNYIEIDLFRSINSFSIYVFGNTTVTFTSNTYNNIPYLYIFNDPVIFFNCSEQIIDIINILGSPTIHANNNTKFGIVNIFNPNYQFPLNCFKINYYSSDLIEQKKRFTYDNSICNYWISDDIKYAIKNGFRRVCFKRSGYLFYQGNSEGEIIVIQSRFIMIAAAFIVGLILVIIVSFYLIAFCRYKIGYKNDNEIEFSDQEDED